MASSSSAVKTFVPPKFPKRGDMQRSFSEILADKLNKVSGVSPKLADAVIKYINEFLELDGEGIGTIGKLFSAASASSAGRKVDSPIEEFLKEFLEENKASHFNFKVEEMALEIQKCVVPLGVRTSPNAGGGRKSPPSQRPTTAPSGPPQRTLLENVASKLFEQINKMATEPGTSVASSDVSIIQIDLPTADSGAKEDSSKPSKSDGPTPSDVVAAARKFGFNAILEEGVPVVKVPKEHLQALAQSKLKVSGDASSASTISPEVDKFLENVNALENTPMSESDSSYFQDLYSALRSEDMRQFVGATGDGPPALEDADVFNNNFMRLVGANVEAIEEEANAQGRKEGPVKTPISDPAYIEVQRVAARLLWGAADTDSLAVFAKRFNEIPDIGNQLSVLETGFERLQ
jgi:hypothetical protein